MHGRARVGVEITSALALAVMIAACATSTGPNSEKVTISVIFSDYSFNSPQVANAYYGSITKQFEHRYPGDTLKVIHIGGTDVDETNQAALLERSPSTAPDVVSLETGVMGQFIASNFLLPLNSRLPSSAFWASFPPQVKNLYDVKGQYYAVSVGNNNQALIYSRQILQKAGIPLPWRPRTWADILTAARQIKQRVPGVVPIWLGAGVPQGPFNVLEGVGNLVLGSSTPTMLDPHTRKWVVQSPGLAEVFNLYRAVFSEGLGPPTSQNFSPSGLGAPATMMRQGKLGIILGSNWIPESWFIPPSGSLYWPQSKTLVGTAPIPASHGQGTGYAGNILAGWALGISRSSSHPDLAWDLIQLMEQPQNLVQRAIASGFIPPTSTAAHLPAFLGAAPPFQVQFNGYVRYGATIPLSPNFPVYARALNQATGAIAEHPSTSAAAAMQILRSGVASQLGNASVEALP